MSELKSWVGPPSQLDVCPVPVCQVRAVPSLETQLHVLVLGYVPKSQDTTSKRGATGKEQSGLLVETGDQLQATELGEQ
jgi:hypothetical protein